MTRQNVTDGPREILTQKCPVCHGDGIVVSDETVALDVERKLRSLATGGSRVQGYRVAVHPRILPLLAGPAGARLEGVEDAARRRFYLVGAEGEHVHLDHLEVLAQGKLVDLAPDAPVAEGDEVQLKLLEVGLHDAGAGVGTIDGLEVVVAGAAKLVGKKARVRIARVLDGVAFAALADGGAAAEAITFESEAEKPTRAPSRARAKAEVAPAAGAEAAAEELTDVDDGVEDAEPGPVDEAVTTSVDGDPGLGAAKKKTRRGSRGGRRRKKKPELEAAGEPAEAPAGAGEEPPPAETEGKKPSRKRTPRIHVPARDGASDADDGANGRPSAVDEEPEPAPLDVDAAVEEDAGEPGDESKPRKKTRRGTRGGRGRRKSSTTAADNGDEASAGAEPADDEAPEGEYVPMSEWIEDLD
jgi:predicted RNA-binding protein with TRAM domain